MPNKTKQQNQNALFATVICVAVLQADDVIKVTANNTVNQAAAGDVPRGYIVKSATAAGGTGSVRLKGQRIVEIKAVATVAANDEVKLAALSSGAQQVTPFIAGTDAENLKYGWALIGAAAGSTATIVEY